MSEIKGICRLCAAIKPQSDLICDLTEIEQTDLTLANYVNYYCRIQLSKDRTLPQKICRVCRLLMETFIAFCDNLKKVEAGQMPDRGIVKDDPTDDSSLKPKKEEKLSNGEHPGENVSHFSSKFSVKIVAHLFKDILKRSFFELEDYSHVTVSRENVLKNGEISTKWLKQYDLKTWADFAPFSCHNCRQEVGSIADLMGHFERGPCKFKLRCKLDRCNRSFVSFNAFVNHTTKNHEHHLHLQYTCFVCNKLMYNIASLINHYVDKHPTISFFFPCIECGYYASNATSLKAHFLTHENQELQEDDVEPFKTEVRVRADAGSKRASPSTDVKQGDNNKRRRREVYECDKCGRVLLTPPGLVYHKKVCRSL